MFSTINRVLFVSLACLFSLTARAQDISIELGESEVALNETFTIKVTVSGEKIRSYDQLPEISGFQKQGVSQSSSMNIVNGQMSSTNSIIQYYKPIRKGQFTLPNFTLSVNEKSVSSPGKTITVVDARASARNNRALDPFDDLFGGNNSEEPEYVEVEDDAFFSLSVDKEEVYVGEGFNVSLAFYMSESNQAPFNFHEPGKQLERIINEIKPGNAWEENFNITSIQPERVEFGGKQWTKYKVYEASFFPFNAGSVDFPSVGWEMIKYRIAKNPSFFGSNRLQDFKTFYSQPKSIQVNALPPHPLKNEVSVGNYRLRESFEQKEVQTGEGFTYDFTIIGEGNISSIRPPRLKQRQKLNTFDPNEQLQINRGRGKVTGMKEFGYFITLNEQEEVALKDHFEWIYFNPQLARYDTLIPQAIVQVTGESKINQAISSSRLGGLYDLIEVEDNKLLNQGYKYYFSALINGLLLLGVILLGFLMFKKK
ncbi:BatD family protein [Cyclobacterium jeungdonense]|uniref:BatD family protein n=1 Tax=Cyclobacterium jeungdonense TaxID=708087 RepID=A0ABT8C624_9BACT|nr:BatD family protein [Cyclobacterium jeungdonense]MDN3687827.1 BatD family protein [Cyclobacterium jeungdonense]